MYTKSQEIVFISHYINYIFETNFVTKRNDLHIQ